MRNGNIEELIKHKNFEKLFILPMRNGNEAQGYLRLFKVVAFYPTYEEWKLCFNPLAFFFYILFILPMRNGNSF